MANYKSFRWCVLVIAFLMLFAYQRHQNNKPVAIQTVDSAQLQLSAASGDRSPELSAPARVDDFHHDAEELPVPDAVEEMDDFSTESVTGDLEMLEFDDARENAAEIVDVESYDARHEGIADVGNQESNPGIPTEPTEIERPDSKPESSGAARRAESKLVQQVQTEQMHSNLVGEVKLPQGVQIKVVHHIEYGKSLARRGAVFGAKQEFQAALRLVAQAVDLQRGTQDYSEKLFKAMLALQESDDFYFAQAESNRRINVAVISQRHQSKILPLEHLTKLNPMEAMQAYYNYVQEQLVSCSGHTIVAGEALYSLGKLYNMTANNALEGTRLDSAKAIVFHNAALHCDPNNFKSANELGVLLAKTGRPEKAKLLFLRSLKIHQSPQVWENLAFVHQQLGEQRLAQLANKEYQTMLGGPAANRIMWIAPETFAEQSLKQLPMRTASLPNAQNQPENKQESSAFKNMMKKLF